MSTDHRKPLVAFVLLALAAAVLVGVGRAHADAGRLFEAAGGRTVHVRGVVPVPGASSSGGAEASGLGPAFDALAANEEPTALSGGRMAHVPDGKGKRARRTAPVSRDAVRRPFGASRAYAAAGERGSAGVPTTGAQASGPTWRLMRRESHAGKRTSDSREAGRAQRPARTRRRSRSRGRVGRTTRPGGEPRVVCPGAPSRADGPTEGAASRDMPGSRSTEVTPDLWCRWLESPRDQAIDASRPPRPRR